MCVALVSDVPHTGPCVSAIVEDLAIDRLDTLYLFIGERGEFLFSRALRQAASILVQEAKQKIAQPFRHLDDGDDLLTESIVPLQERGLLGKIMLDRSLHAAIQKFCMRSRVEEAIKIAGAVENMDIELRGRLPFDQGQQ